MKVWIDFGKPVTIPIENGSEYCAMGLTMFMTIGEARRCKREYGGVMFRYIDGERVEVA